MSTSQRLVFGVAALLIALRAFFPIRYVSAYGLRTDFFTTLLHMVGILTLAVSLYILTPSLGSRGLVTEFRKGWTTVAAVALFLVLTTMRVLNPVQLAPTNGQYSLEFPFWSTERLLLTLGLFDASTIGPGWSVKPDWTATNVHFVVLLLTAGLWAWWRWPRD